MPYNAREHVPLRLQLVMPIRHALGRTGRTRREDDRGGVGIVGGRRRGPALARAELIQGGRDAECARHVGAQSTTAEMRSPGQPSARAAASSARVSR